VIASLTPLQYEKRRIKSLKISNVFFKQFAFNGVNLCVGCHLNKLQALTMKDEAKNLFDARISILTLIGSVIAFAFTIITWKEQNHIKRAEFLEAKITEFQDTTKLIARSILDGYAVCDTCNNTRVNITDQEMIAIGSSRTGDTTDIKLENLGNTLSERLPSINISKQRVRQSFDRLLDFFGKLEYYIGLDLMTKDEVKYFRYYIDKCAKNEAIWSYAKNYEFTLFLDLVKRLKIGHDEPN
jgi:hypothetical protein